MESNTKYKLEPEDEKFLEEVSAVFEPVREKYIIRDAVQKKVAGSNFRFIDFTKPGGLLAWKYPLIITAIVGLTVGSWFAFKPSGDESKSELQAAKSVKIETVLPSAENTVAGNEEAVQLQTNENVNAVSNEKQQLPLADNHRNQILADSKSGRTLQVLTKKQAFNRVEKTEKIEHKTTMQIPSNINPVDLKQKLTGVLNNLGLRPSDNPDSGSLLLLQSQPVQGYYSKIDNKPVEFYIEFSIMPNNPSKLFIKLIFTYDNSGDTSRGRDYDMENIFYDKLKSELIKLFS
jgi:hypothetical protein